MSFYKNQAGRPLSVTLAEEDVALVPPNTFVHIDPKVERMYDTKRKVRLGLLVRCGSPSENDVCIYAPKTRLNLTSSIAGSAFSESLVEFKQ
tara:strand:+ start:2830 stop:3105 length:276 start_codon:yes stop_codon:yes gene_type:complete